MMMRRNACTLLPLFYFSGTDYSLVVESYVKLTFSSDSPSLSLSVVLMLFFSHIAGSFGFSGFSSHARMQDILNFLKNVNNPIDHNS